MQVEQQNKQNMKKRIIISTSWSKLEFLQDNREKKRLQLLENNLFIGYCYLNNEFVALKSDTDIILIQDIATKETLVGANINFNKDTDYFLHHTNDNGLFNDQEDLFGSKIQKGAHETRHEDFYQPIFEFILGDLENKADHIIELLFPTLEIILGQKLDLLNNLLVPPTDFTAAQNQWEELNKAVKTANDSGIKVSLSSDANALEDFITKSKGKTDAFDPEYLSALTTLRDKLLVS